MNRFSIAVLPGDGIGPEVIEQAVAVAERAASTEGARLEWVRYPWNSQYYLQHGRMAPDDFLEQLAGHDAILLGAVGHPSLPDHVTAGGLIFPIRRRFDQCVCIRPAYLYEGVSSPLRDKKPGDIDILVFRENTEGEYVNVGGRVYQQTDHEVAVQTSLYTRRGCRRIMEAAFEAARGRRRKVTSITKSNAQGYGMVLWDEVFRDVASAHTDIETESLLIDRTCMDLIRRPEQFDVLVASNLFGDILTDLAAVLVGSLGLAPSANINPERTDPSMFEPVHGSAPDIAGEGVANPLAAILSAGMMLEHLGLTKAAATIHRAVAALLREGGPRTPDLGGHASTTQVGQAVCEYL